jgi:hypothetical protein
MFSLLLQCMWRGEIELELDPSVTESTRRVHLKIVHAFTPKNDERLAFVEHEDEIPPLATMLPDGRVEFNSRTRIKLSADPAMWTDAEVDAACDTLTSFSYLDYSESVLPLLMWSRIHRDQFAVLCDTNDWPRPSFWFATARPSSSVITKVTDRTQCRSWLRVQARRSARPRKAELLAEALRRFPSLSQRTFQQLWRELAPEAWRKAGRPPIRPR